VPAIYGKDNTGGDHRPGKWSSAGFIAAGNATIAFFVQVPFESEVVAMIAATSEEAFHVFPGEKLIAERRSILL